MSVRILRGDCREVLKTLPDESVHCVVTSPPYWGLRDYGTAKWEGGEVDCLHTAMRQQYAEAKQATSQGSSRDPIRGEDCRICGARRIDSQLGLEPTPQEYVANMVEVFREVRRVLRADGTCWLNLGDSYAANRTYQVHNTKGAAEHTYSNGTSVHDGLKPKDLVGIPWRAAFALQADGWWLRQDIIWHKPNPMPESVTDRCTKAHEYIFLLAKSERYYYDAAAIAEEAISGTDLGLLRGKSFEDGINVSWHAQSIKDRQDAGIDSRTAGDGKRNKRSVWTVTTKAFTEAHFATFPPDLIEPCILAGCPEGGTVLDPFGGAGTTGLVADRLQRSAILIELNPEYAAMAERRIVGDAPLFAEVTA